MKKDFHNPPQSPCSGMVPRKATGYAFLATGLILLFSSFPLDSPIRSIIQTYRTPFFLTAMQWMTQLGGILTLLSLSLFLLGIGYAQKVKRLKQCGGIALLTLLSGSLISEGIKYLAGRPRPFLSETGLKQWGPTAASGFDSFPSGHATSIFAFALILSFFYPRAKIPAFSMAVLVAFSRLYLDVHFFSDVIAGALLGMGTATLLVQFVRLPMPPYPMNRPDEKPVDRKV